MDEIINKLIKTEKKKNKKDSKKDVITFNQIELEIQLKIETEKTKQLELIKDIKKIEKSIKQKELYNRRTYFSCKKCIQHKLDCDDDVTNTDTDSESFTSDNDFDTKSLCRNSDITIDSISTTDHDDSLSLCSSDIESDNNTEYYTEVDIISLK